MFIVDGKFLLRTFGMRDSSVILYAAGVPMHLVTSGYLAPYTCGSLVHRP
jgi:hypothetical protein